MTHQIEQFVSGAGLLGPLLFVLTYAVLTVLLVPGSVSTLAAGALFGALWGTVLTVIGATLGATAAFALARRGGRARVQRAAGPRVERVDEWLSGRGFLAVLYVRLFPIVPFSAFNYAAGLSGISRRDYVAGTAIGIVPGTFAFVALGDALGKPGSPKFLIALALVVVLAVAAPLVDRVRGRRSRAPAEQPGVADEERHEEVQTAPDPGRRGGVSGEEDPALVDQREEDTDHQRDEARAPEVGSPAAEHDRVGDAPARRPGLRPS